jgi:integral membrane protein (TIGR01906 family)
MGRGRYDGRVKALLPALGAVLVAVAMAADIVAVAVLVFLNPIWVGFEQDRSGVDQLTGYSSAQVRQVTGSILSDLVFGPPSFDVAVGGAPVLDARERDHMADVRTLLLRLGLVAAVAAVVLLAAGLLNRGRRRFWRAVSGGAVALAGAVVAVGLAFAVFFDQAFELFHRLFFPPGTYLFDPASERLVQLFPDQFWYETSVALAAVVLGLAVLVALLGRRLAGRASPGPATVVASSEVRT